jgi:four helix bundle protein
VSSFQEGKKTMAVTTFEDLEVWRRSCQLAVDVCVAVHDSKDYALKDQMQRSAISIPSNIAEGAERDSDGDFIRFLRISKGSCGELRTQLYISERVRKKLGQAPVEESRPMIQETKRSPRCSKASSVASIPADLLLPEH